MIIKEIFVFSCFSLSAFGDKAIELYKLHVEKRRDVKSIAKAGFESCKSLINVTACRTNTYERSLGFNFFFFILHLVGMRRNIIVCLKEMKKVFGKRLLIWMIR